MSKSSKSDSSGSANHEQTVLRRVDRLARMLDSKFSIPGTKIRFGWDALVGLIPIAGDSLTLIPQAYLLIEGIRLKVPKRTLFRMLVNIGLDWLIGLVPVLGDLFDVAFKSNLRNAALLSQAFSAQSKDQPSDLSD